MSTKKILYIESDVVETNKISILEKIDRLKECQDPDLMDINSIQYFAENLGYDVNINRGELGNLALATDDTNTCSADDADRYLRFAIRNLPLWYKTKTTNNSLKIMLYSFGMVGDISQYYTNNYLPEKNGGKWIAPDYSMSNNDLSQIPKDFYPTPHFIVWINLDLSENNLNIENAKRDQIVNAIESIRPANTVFKRLGAYTTVNYNIYMNLFTRFHSRYIKIPANGDSDGWHPLMDWYGENIGYSMNVLELNSIGSGITEKTYYQRIKLYKAVAIIDSYTGSDNIIITMRYASPFASSTTTITLFSGIGNGTHEYYFSPIFEDFNYTSINFEVRVGGANATGNYNVQLFNVID